MLLDAGTTFADILFNRSRETPSRLCYAIHTAAGSAPLDLRYGALDMAARALAARMLARAVPGDRIILLVSDIADFVPAFFACLQAGLVAVPTPVVPGRGAHVTALIADADPRLIVTTSAEWARIGASIGGFSDQLLFVDDAAEPAAPLARPLAQRADLALLQYTSGSTGQPRGVMISHANLVANARAMQALCDPPPDRWCVSWLPLFHDMGLMGGLLQPFFANSPCALMPPAAFVARPQRWLALIARLDAFACAAPNFAYDLCTDRIDAADMAGIDLACWQVALCGAEPVRADTLDRFAASFAPFGFRAEAFSPCYGLAEATLAVTGTRAGARPRRLDLDADALGQGRVRSARRAAGGGRRTIVSCGMPVPGIGLAIADPARSERAGPGQVGEIWIAGDQVSIGYWRQPAASAQRMDGALADAPGQRWLRSGDLGFVHDGELFVTGRMDDMILVRGRNHAPQDIEHTVEMATPALRANAAAAFLAIGASGEGVGRDGLVVVAELNRRTAAAKGRDILHEVRAAVAAEHGLDLVGLALLKPNGLARTTSGKVRRRATAAAWNSGTLHALFRWDAVASVAVLPPRPDGGADAALILGWLTARCAMALGLEEAAIAPELPVIDLGLSSQQALVIATEFSDWLGQPVAPTILVEDGLSLAALAQAHASPAPPAMTAPMPTAARLRSWDQDDRLRGIA